MNACIKALFSTLLLITLSACASRLDYESPSAVDLNGVWLLDSSASQEVVFSAARSSRGSRGEKGKGKPGGGKRGGERGSKPGGDDDRLASGRGGRSIKKGDSAVAVEMKIEHVSDSMGILYQSGNYRDIDWGVVEKRGAKITAGWDDESLVVKTQRQRGTVIETYTLSADNSSLSVLFEVDGGEYIRVYRRQKDEQ